MQVMTRIADGTPLRTLRCKGGCMPLNEPAIACSSMNNIAHIAITLNFKTWTCSNIEFQNLDLHKPGAIGR